MNTAVERPAPAPKATPFDEAFTVSGSPRPAYAGLIRALESRDLRALGSKVQADIDAIGLRSEGQQFRVDAIPRLFSAEEWEELSRGVSQRVRALNAFLEDAYSEQRAVAAGVLPARVIDEAEYFEPLARTLPTPVHARMAGLDLIRDRDGAFRSLEDNLRTPAGLAAVISVRDPIESRLEVSLNPLPVDGIPGQMLSSLRGADPSGGGDPAIALLSDGRGAAPWRGHRELGRRLGIPVVAQEQLYASRGRIRAWVGDRSREIRVLYRRTAEEKLSGRSGALTALGRLLIGPLRAGTISCVNAFGAGLADDKAVHAYSDNLIRFYLGEEPLVPAIRAYDLGAGDQLSEALQRLDELVVKGRGGSGGEEVVIAEGLASDGLRTVAAEIQRAPCAYIAQEKVTLSTHPAIADGAMAPRHVDLRPFALLTNGSVTVAPGAFTRFATKPGEMIVNATRGGGGKDTWILPAEDVVPAEPQR